jgi:hypothetical protein
MKDELFAKFRKTGKVSDYLKYRDEVSKEFKANDRKEKGDHSKLDRLQRKS